MNIGNVIKKRREELQLTQTNLAEKLHVSRSAISNWEQGRNYPDLKILLNISDELNLSLDILLRSDPQMATKMSLDSKKKKKLKISILLLSILVFILLCVLTILWQKQLTTFSPNELTIEQVKKIEKPVKKINGVKTHRDYAYIVYVKSNSLLKTFDTVKSSNNNYTSPDKVSVSFQAKNSVNIFSNHKKNEKIVALKIDSYAAQEASNNNDNYYNLGKNIYLVDNHSHQQKIILSKKDNK